MKATKVLGIFAFILLASTLLAQPVSAGNDLFKLQRLESILSNADSYDIVWDGPAKGNSLFFTASKGSPSALSTFDFENGEFDIISYEKNNIRDYSSSSYGYPGYGGNRRYGGYGSYGYGGYGGYGNSYGSSFSDRRYFNDNSERIYIDNTANNLARHDVQRTAILTAGSVLNTNILEQANVENTRTLSDRDVQITGTLTYGEIVKARIGAIRDVQLRQADVESTGILSDRDTEIVRLTTQADVDRTSLIVDGETERSRIFSDRDTNLAQTARDKTRIIADRDVDTTRLQTNRDIEIAEIKSFTELARTDIIANPYPRYDSGLGYYNWRY